MLPLTEITDKEVRIFGVRFTPIKDEHGWTFSDYPIVRMPELPDLVIHVEHRMMGKSKHQIRVEQFMACVEFYCGSELQHVPMNPRTDESFWNGEVGLKIRRLRARLVLEEAMEMIRDGLGLNSLAIPDDVTRIIWDNQGAVDLVALADGAFDLSVVNTGTLSVFGIKDLVGQEVVDLNNLEKFKFGPDGRAKFRVDGKGKLIKPADHQKPDLAKVIEINR
jgi:hypothetical protein